LKCDGFLSTRSVFGAMIRTALAVLVADIILLAAMFSVFQDLQWRTGYAASTHAGTAGYAPSFSYSLLIQFFNMAGKGVSLTSPPTLDWVQTLAYVLVVLNVWFAVSALKNRARQRRGPNLSAP